MAKRTLAYCLAVLMSAALYTACGDSIKATDCSTNCQDVDNSCVQKCNDDQCRSACTTDLDNCNTSCGSVTISPPAHGDGG